jgi:hypothetical protein
VRPEGREETPAEAVEEPRQTAAVKEPVRVEPPPLEPAPEDRPGETKEAPEPEALPEVASLPPQPQWEPVDLRHKPADLMPEDVRQILTTYDFYATCWSYNGDYCNPEGDFPNRYRDNGDGTVTDEATGLMWQKGGSSEPMTWADAREFAGRMNREALAGYADWRLPTVEEIGSLMERSWQNHDLFIDPLFDKHQRILWSTDTRGVESAWKANLHMGFIIDFPMDSQESVRLVRTAR